MRERNPRSPKSGPLRLKAAKSQSVRYTRKLCAPKDQHLSHNCVSEGDTCRAKSDQRKAPDSRVAPKECQPHRAYVDSYDSSSESDSVTGDRTPGLSLAPTKSVRRSRYETSMRKKVVLNNNGEDIVKRKEIIKTLGMEVSEYENRVRASGLNLRGGDPKHKIENGNLCDDTTSSLEDDSACSSGKLSEKKTGWTWTCSTCTETESQQRDVSPPERPAKKSCGARASIHQASREVPRIWNSIERITSKSLYHSNGRLGESKESQIVYQTGSGMKAEDKDVEDRHRYVSEGQACLQDRYKDEKQRKDVNKFRMQESGRQAHAKSVLEISTKIGPEQFHAEIAWIASAGSTRAPQRFSDQKDKIDEGIKLKIEKLHDEVPHGSNGVKTKEHGSHNRLREAVEAVWKTSLGTKEGVENKDVEKDLLEHCYWDLHNENLSVSLFGEESPYEKLEKKSSVQVDTDDKVAAYKKAWKATLETNNSRADNHMEKEPADPVFWCIQRDHENLEALVAREEGLRKDQKVPTMTEVPAEGRAREATELKSPLHEASAEDAEGIRVLPHETAEFHSKFKEELQQGPPDTSNMQELLHVKNPNIESGEAEGRDARKNPRQLSTEGTRENKSPQQEARISSMLLHPDFGPGNPQWKLMAESESRIAAEAKASYFEACAKAAEKRMHSLLGERNWYYKRFVEEVEYNSDMKKLQHLMELEKANQGRQRQKQRKKMDVRLLVASSVADDVLDEVNEDGQGALQRGVDEIISFQSDQEEVLQVETCGDCDRLEYKKWEQEIETMSERKGLAQDLRVKITRTQKESSNLKKDDTIVEDIFIPAEDICTPAAFIPRHEDRETRQEYITQKNIRKKNEKKRPLSPINCSGAQHWNPPEFTESGKIENSCLRGRSPFECNQSLGSPQKSELTAPASSDLEEDTLDVRKSSDNPLYNCSESPVAASCRPLPLPTKWVKETKAELHKIMQEQELTWKMAEKAVEEVSRRLEVLENYKTNLQDSVRLSRTMGNGNGLLSRLEKNLEDFPGGFNVLYSCPIFEQDIESGTDTNPAQERCLSPNLSQISKDYEIQLLKTEIVHLRNEISRRERSRSPQMKSDFHLFPPAPRPRKVPLPPLVPGHSTNLMSGFQAFVTDRDLSRLENVSEEHHSVPVVIATETESELPDDPFEEKIYSAKKEAPRSRSNSPTKVDRYAHYEKFAPIRRVHGVNGSCWSETPKEENGAEIDTPIVENHTNSEPRRMGYPSYGQEGNRLEAGNLKSDEVHLHAGKTAVEKLSDIFSEQEAKFKNLNEENTVPSETTEPRAYYLNLLKRLSEQLAELCHDLYVDAPSQQECHEVRSMDKSIAPTLTHVNMEVEQEKTKEEVEPKGIMTNNDSCRAEHSHEMVVVPTRGFPAESENRRDALQAAERKLQEELKTHSLLTKKLESQAKYISQVMAENAEELERKDKIISYEQQVNMHISHDMAQTETSLANLRSQNKELVGGLDSRLQAARNEVKSLRDTVQALKIDLEQKETLASSSKGERIKTEPQIQDLRHQIQAFQCETDAMVGEKSELTRTFQQTRTEADEQQNRIKEFISINEDLIAVAQSKESEIKTLTKMVTSLQQSISEKSDEAERLLGETARLRDVEKIQARDEGETNRHHHEFLCSKLQETEQELMSREEAMERLTVHLGTTIEGQHFILEEKEQLLSSLNKAQSKERTMEDEVQHLKTVIQDLEEKINGMDAGMTRIKTEIEDIKTRRQNSLAIERQTQELKNRVHQLEEEIMEKEGQISILTSSFP